MKHQSLIGTHVWWQGLKCLVVNSHGYANQTLDLRWTISGVSGSRDEVSGHKRGVRAWAVTPIETRPVEVFYAKGGHLETQAGDPMPAGWYWWPCYPNNGYFEADTQALRGPFNTKDEADQDAEKDRP